MAEEKLLTKSDLDIIHDKLKELHKIISRADGINCTQVLNILSDIGAKIFN